MKLKKIFQQICEESLAAASTRRKTSNKHKFNPPIEGPNGNKLISYEWAWKESEKFSKHDGGLVGTRVSDWDRALQSAETGKDLVHQFTVETSEGEKVVSAESVIYTLGFADKKVSGQMPYLVNAVKTLAKLQMELSVVQQYKEQLENIKAAGPQLFKPIKGSEVYYEDGALRAFDIKTDSGIVMPVRVNGDKNIQSSDDLDVEMENSSETLRQKIQKDIFRKQIELSGLSKAPGRPEYELNDKIKKQEQKIQQLSQQHNKDV